MGPYYLAYLVFLLIPGFVTLRAFHFSHISLDTYSRLNKLAVVVIGGFLSLIAVTVLYRIDVPELTYVLLYDTMSCGRSAVVLSVEAGKPLQWPSCSPQTFSHSMNNPVTSESIKSLSLLESSLILIVQSSIGILMGFWYGQFKREIDGEDTQTREKLAQPWERAYAISDVGDEATVITTQNREIRGTIKQIGSPSKDNDLLLENPEEVVRGEYGTLIHSRPAGEYSYHHYRDIARIEFNPENEDDPDGDTEGVKSFFGQIKVWVDALDEVPPGSYLRQLYEGVVNLRNRDGSSEEELDSLSVED